MSSNNFLNHIRPLVAEIDLFIDKISQDLSEIDAETNQAIATFSAEAINDLSLCRRIVYNLGLRTQEIKSLLDEGHTDAFLKAVDLLEKPLELPSDPMNCLLGSQVVEPILPKLWLKYPKNLLIRIKEEISYHKKAQQRLNQRPGFV